MRRDQDLPPLLERARAPGFTPGRKDIAPLLDALCAAGDDDVARAAERALCRRPDAATGAALARLDSESGVAGRARLARLLGRLAAGATPDDREAAAERLAALLGDGSARVRRQAALALGRFGAGAPLDALSAAWAAEREAPVLRAVAEALGKVGGPRAIAALAERADDRARDPELERIASRARITAARTMSRAEPSAIDLEAAPPRPLRVLLHCRAGLERLLADEASAGGWAVAAVSPGRVETALTGPLGSLFRLRLWDGFGFPLAPAADTVQAITSPEASEVFAAFTRGAARFRIAFAGGGHRRAEVWRIAREVAARRADLVNDPSGSSWQVVVSERPGAVLLELEPRRIDDPRFAYRVAEVPAASHPTIAAALARLATLHSLDPAADVVWDPFVGSGLELVERAIAAPVRALVGTDIDPDALAAARANLDAARVTAELRQGDALAGEAPPATVVLTNPPMGRRVARGRAEDLLLRLVDRAGAVLPRGGILCWISPHPGKTRARAARGHLRLVAAQTLDMGGFAAEIQVFRQE
ncbi:MAG TPA: HEAT repeat domain-containing protein [Kofleriaceae bacterium]|nr:HEAT repeat domain-containing protein [Kofleriaceae bacterium]